MEFIVRAAVVFGVALVLGGCSARKPKPATLTLATTTSTQDSGLLNHLLPIFEKQSGIKVIVVAVGSGQALELGRRGDADVILTHSPDAEQEFMSEGFGSQWRPVMHNDFVIAGPAEDPAGIKQLLTGAEAFRAISEKHAPFVSRGDDSGTHQKERAIWNTAGVEPVGDWYLQAGAGMVQALRVANERRAYVLTDRATYLAMKHEFQLGVLLEGDEQLLNRYSVITVNRAKHPHIRDVEADALADFLTSRTAKKRIAAFGVEQFGQPLFVPEVSR